MRILLAAVLATVIAAPCMAANENDGDKAPSDALTPGVNEPRTPDTLKSAPDQRIQTEGRASETAGEKREPNGANDRK
jgi:hypothetical protein